MRSQFRRIGYTLKSTDPSPFTSQDTLPVPVLHVSPILLYYVSMFLYNIIICVPHVVGSLAVQCDHSKCDQSDTYIIVHKSVAV